MITFETDRLTILADETTGYLRSIVGKNDPAGAEWVLAESDWGQAENFQTESASYQNGALRIQARHVSAPLTMNVEKRVENGRFTEQYAVTNVGNCDFFCHPDTFGILFPFNTLVRGGGEQMDRVCTAHVWCGGSTAWIYGHKLSGKGPQLLVYLDDGSIGDYSIRYEALTSRNGGFYRGDIQLDPTPCALMPGETRTYRFVYDMTDKPQKYLTEDTDSLLVSADRYSALPGEPITLSVSCRRGLEDLSVSVNDEDVPVSKNGDRASAVVSFEDLGEKTVTVSAGGKTTLARLNVIEPPEVILQKRARFIAKKQQYHRAGSAYDGAYLTYDDTEKSLVCEPWGDRNCGHERIAMGVIVALALQRQADPVLHASLEQYLTFVRRELLEEESGTVFTEAGRSNGERRRFFNDPWVAVLFREAYRYNGDITYLHIAFRIMDQYFRLFGRTHDGTVVEVYELCELLEQAGLTEESRTLQAHLYAYLDHFLVPENKLAGFQEVGYCHEYPDIRAKLYFEAYLHTKNETYRRAAEEYYQSAGSFYSFQPDYHFFGISVRNWDAFWFGKKRQFGDTFPHYWSCDLAETVAAKEKVLPTGTGMALIRSVLMGNLCLYRPDGFAANTYLSPYHVRFRRPEDNPGVVPDGAFYGKTYDEFANDQDWALYFAVKLLTKN